MFNVYVHCRTHYVQCVCTLQDTLCSMCMYTAGHTMFNVYVHCRTHYVQCVCTLQDTLCSMCMYTAGHTMFNVYVHCRTHYVQCVCTLQDTLCSMCMYTAGHTMFNVYVHCRTHYVQCVCTLQSTTWNESLLQMKATGHGNLVTSVGSGLISLWRPANGKLIYHLKGQSNTTNCLEVVGDQLISAASNGNIVIHTSFESSVSYVLTPSPTYP